MDNIRQFANWMNSDQTYLQVTKFTLYVCAFFFSLFSVVMIRLKPKVLSMDMGWTWVIVAINIVVLRTLGILYWDFTQKNFIGVLTWLNLTAAAVFSTSRFIYEKLCENYPRIVKMLHLTCQYS